MKRQTELATIADGAQAPARRGGEARWRRRSASQAAQPSGVGQPPRAAQPSSPPATALVARPPWTRATRWRRCWPALLAVLSLGGGLCSVAVWHESTQDERFSLQVSAGCESIEPCQKLEAEAALRVQACWFGCGRELAEQRVARLQRYRAEERSAVREHYRQREDAERNAEQLEHERQLATWQREQAAKSALSEQEQRQRLELERLRQERIDRRVLEERQRRVGYLALLGAEGRLERLRRCHADKADKAGCEALILDLVEATSLADEKRKLAAENEKLLAGGSRALSAPRQPALPPANS
jgi:hypothetical protein